MAMCQGVHDTHNNSVPDQHFSYTGEQHTIVCDARDLPFQDTLHVHETKRWISPVTLDESCNQTTV